jgi:preprotein translocase subunit SecA
MPGHPSTALRHGVPRGAYAERQQSPYGRLEQFSARVAGPAMRSFRVQRLRPRRLLREVAVHERAMVQLGSRAIQAVADDLRHRLRLEGFALDAVARTFALVREVASRMIGMRHFDVQLIGGGVLLNGMVAEMETGEGKTLTATLPACTVALAGFPVHIITVNDYLARRDAESMDPIYKRLGLSVGVIVQGMDAQARRAAYACDVTYCTNKEVAFDYLKDRIVLGRSSGRLHLQLERLTSESTRYHQLLMRGLYYAIVDEADSVLVDEARTPLIISGGSDHSPEQQVYETALSLAAQLVPQRDFVIEGHERAMRLTAAGQERLADLAHIHGGIWSGRRRREELVRQALVAQHLIQRDLHYLVQDGKVQIIDEYSGRVMPDRSWEHGLHQLIETKEGCVLTDQHEPLARISYQRFFRRYLRLAGMTGTAREVSSELWSVYRLPVVTVATNQTRQRRCIGQRVYPTTAAKWAAVVNRMTHLHRQGRPMLIGTRSVAASEHLSQLLTEAGLSHQVLNARQDQQEAEIIALAGQLKRITVATNMAGRGTDIRLASGVVELGGLYVLATEGHEARRIDRQLFGRCGRQGDPGHYELMASLEDDLITAYANSSRRRQLLVFTARHSQAFAPWFTFLVLRLAQRAAERLHSRMRRDLLKMDEHLETALAFSGRLE